jgi:hypothetical protein
MGLIGSSALGGRLLPRGDGGRSSPTSMNGGDACAAVTRFEIFGRAPQQLQIPTFQGQVPTRAMTRQVLVGASNLSSRAACH